MTLKQIFSFHFNGKSGWVEQEALRYLISDNPYFITKRPFGYVFLRSDRLRVNSTNNF
jgi:hypothetical protein